MTGHRVLIVDDEPGIREALKQVLEYEGLEVMTAASGGEALTVYQEYRPHLVFLDVKMAGLDGLETLSRLSIGSEEDAKQGVSVCLEELSGRPRIPFPGLVLEDSLQLLATGSVLIALIQKVPNLTSILPPQLIVQTQKVSWRDPAHQSGGHRYPRGLGHVGPRLDS